MKTKSILFLVLLMFMFSCGSKVDPFSAALGNLTDQVKQIIDKAQSAGLVLEVTAGAQVLNTITQARQAYENGLIKSSDALSSQQQSILNGLNSSVKNIQDHVLEGLTLRIQSVANTIPFSNKFPQMTSFSGTITDGSDNYSLIKLTGNFFDIPNEGYQAILNIGGKKIENTIRSTSLITFMIPKIVLKKDPSKISYMPVSIEVPYKKGWFNKKAISTFNLILIILPGMSPGQLVVIQNKSVDIRKDTTITTPNKTWDAGDGDVESVQGFDVIPGWIIDVNSVGAPLMGERGRKDVDWYDLGNSSTPTFVGWKIKATHKNSPWGNNGAVTLHFTYRAYKYIPQLTDIKKDTLDLKWGGSRVITIEPLANWKMIYKQFDAKTFEIASNFRSNPYINFAQTGSQLQISAVPYQSDLQ